MSLILKKSIILLTMLVWCIPLYADVIQLPSESKDIERFNVLLRSGVKFNSVVYEKLRITERYVLRFRWSAGLTTETPSPQHVITVDDFNLALVEVLDFLESKGKRIEEIQIDLNLVKSTLDTAVNATKNVIRSRNKIQATDARVTKSVRKALKNSELIFKVCNHVIAYSYHCDLTYTLDPVAFDHDYFKRGTKFLLTHETAGLSKLLWFGIDLISKK